MHACVHESGKSQEAIRPMLKLIFIWRAVVGMLYTIEPTDTASNGKLKLLKSRRTIKSRLTWSSLVTVKELDLGVDVVHGCFMEGDDSTVFSGSSSKRSCNTSNKFLG